MNTIFTFSVVFTLILLMIKLIQVMHKPTKVKSGNQTNQRVESKTQIC
jgi:hypothetical protein